MIAVTDPSAPASIWTILGSPALWQVLGPALGAILMAAAGFAVAWLKAKERALASDDKATVATQATQAAVLGLERATQEFSGEVARMLAAGLTPAQIEAALAAKAKATVTRIATAQGAEDALNAVVVGLGLSSKSGAEIAVPKEDPK